MRKKERRRRKPDYMSCSAKREQRNMEEPSGTEYGSSEGCHRRTISGSSENLSNYGSLKNHVLK